MDGSNILVLKEHDVKVITDLMMGGDGTNTDGELGELHLSAISEAMNQMMGSAATSLSSMLNKTIDISPPVADLVDLHDNIDEGSIADFLSGSFVKISFKMEIGDLVDSEIMQLYPVSFAKEMCASITKNMEADTNSTSNEAEKAVSAQPAAPQPQMEQPMGGCLLYTSSSVTFSDILYQTTSNASGANATTGTGGVNAKQIGLGTTAAATKVSITSAGASETTGNPFDIRLTDKNSTNFFIVNNGSENVFTRSGSFYVDGSGNLCMSSTGYTVMGWQVDETTGEIRKDTVSALRIMQEKNLTSAPEATTQATIAGVLDENDADCLLYTSRCV